MKRDPKKIQDKDVLMGYEMALREYADEIKLGESVLRVLDERYKFADED